MENNYSLSLYKAISMPGTAISSFPYTELTTPNGKRKGKPVLKVYTLKKWKLPTTVKKS